MSLRSKVILVLMGIVCLLLVMDAVVLKFAVVRSFEDLEHTQARRNMIRVINAFERETNNLSVTVTDWAAWDDTYEFVVDHNLDYEESNLLFDTFEVLRINLLFIFDRAGRVVWGKVFDLETEEEIGLSEFPAGGLPPAHILLTHETAESSVEGLYRTEQGVMLLTSWPILTSDTEGPIRGTFIMGRFYDDAAVTDLGRQVELALHGWPLGSAPLPDAERAALESITPASPLYLGTGRNGLLPIYASLPSVDGIPALLLRADMTMDVTNVGTRTAWFTFASLFVGGMLIAGVMLALMQQLVVGPLTAFTRHILSLGTEGGHVELHAVRRSDEIGTLAREFQDLLKRLREVHKIEALGRMTAGVAHEFNNLLQIITGSLELVEMEYEGREGPRRHLRGAREAAIRGGELTQRLLSYAGQHPLRREVVEVGAFVSNTVQLVRPLLGETIEIETVTADDVRPIIVDRGQLETALVNLAVNARNAMPEGGKITIEVANVHLDEAFAATRSYDVKTGNYIMLAVHDTGMGMSPEVIEHAFDPFFTTREVGEGTGLGLSMVYGFVTRQSGGYVDIESKEGRGTTVILYLPAAAA